MTRRNDPEREMVRRCSPFAPPAIVAAFLIGAAAGGWDAGWSAAIGVAIVFASVGALYQPLPVPDRLPRVGRRLECEEARVSAAESHEIFVRALLDQAPMLEEQDSVGLPNGREAVGDVDGGPTLTEPAESSEELVLSLSVEG